MKRTKQQIGKASRAAGQRFELKVRADLEKKNWIVDKWSNNVEFHNDEDVHDLPYIVGKLVKVKNKFLGPGRPMMLGAGFPDFIAFRKIRVMDEIELKEISVMSDGSFDPAYVVKKAHIEHEVIGVEAKSNGYLDKTEKQKCDWMLNNNIFSKILIAQKGEKRGEIIYKEYSPNIAGQKCLSS